MQCLLDALLDLQRHTFLNLQAMGKDVHHTGNLRESRDVAVGNVCHMSLSVERQHVVFAEREKVDVLDNDHLRVVFAEECLSQHFVGILLVALRQKLHGLSHTHRSLLQALAVGVFA